MFRMDMCITTRKYEYIYESFQAFTLTWRPAWSHFGVLQSSPKMGEFVYLHAYPGIWVNDNTKNSGSSISFELWVQIGTLLNKKYC